MNKKILFWLVFQICLFSTTLFAQLPPPCIGTSNTCIIDQQVNGPTNWYASHGTLSFPNTNAPTLQPSASKSISMFSYLNVGNGAFTCYKFQEHHTYRVCFWVRNTSGWPSNPWGRLYVYAARDVKDSATGFPIPPPSNFSRQLIDQSYYGPPQGLVHPSGVSDWEFVSTTFTASADYNCLWLFPLNPQGPPPPGPAQWNLEYRIEVDDIRVTEEQPYTLSVTDNNNPISGCGGQTQITISGMPVGAVADWEPAVTVPNPTGNVVIAKPCSTTTYKIKVYDSASSCANCIRETLHYTINVTQWSDPANLIYPSWVACGDPINLDYNDPATCPGVTYTWVDPQGNTYPSKNPPSIVANATHTGEWTLQIGIPGKNCAEELKFDITVGSCCISSPSFTINPSSCNPIKFINTSTGITNYVGALWDFGDGTTSSLKNPVHSFNVTPTQTTFTVCLTMLYEDGQGESCCNQVCQTVQPCANTNTCVVTADFNYANVVGWGNTFDFTDISSGNGTICQYDWDFGDGTPITTTTAPTIRHSYTTAGPWRVCLTVTNCIYDPVTGVLINSCTDLKCMWVYPPPSMVGNPGSGTQVQQIQTQPADAQSQPSVTPVYELDKDKVLTVYPNPNQGSFVLSLYKHTGAYQVLVRDQQGREVYNRKHEFVNGSAQVTLNDVSNGVYSVEVINDSERYTQQISIIR